MKPIRIKSISEFHRLRNLPKPEHPLISIIDYANLKFSDEEKGQKLRATFDFYSISIKRNLSGKLQYGQQLYDFDEGLMAFLAPNQVFGIEIFKEEITNQSGWILMIHPDFLWNTSLAKNIKNYEYFNYSVNEALFLSENDEIIINNIVKNIEQEYHSNIDKFSKQIIVTHLENLLSYAERFYNRQFITREKANHQILERLEKFLTDYFESNNLATTGLPTVQYISDQLNISSTYLLTLLKTLTGRTTQQHIHDKLIANAKEKLSTTDLSVSEIAYKLGFEHLQSFSKFFKTKTKLSPMAFRQSFN
ncbi:AraC family transcriptional regulator [Leeuwenhoekiella aestuarii]|uniref:AraC family transcriptional regulator n=1 Tax=Leeuwenhoekiella aestuarii TaxID=2249426 RepID=A0A4Q0NPJ3_9FLAO|nr:helix-turn-helix domain-containing protein [Leeuwenhoekiella aestuarii]RXG11417.1 AraC family transcriptional regulator [Leeuwenhoekiella aestuarii]RXG12154.1 AraC family transcriptional regulator [Leeuwenhoekiella aestuarii]